MVTDAQSFGGDRPERVPSMVQEALVELYNLVIANRLFLNPWFQALQLWTNLIKLLSFFGIGWAILELPFGALFYFVKAREQLIDFIGMLENVLLEPVAGHFGVGELEVHEGPGFAQVFFEGLEFLVDTWFKSSELLFLYPLELSKTIRKALYLFVELLLFFDSFFYSLLERAIAELACVIWFQHLGRKVVG